MFTSFRRIAAPVLVDGLAVSVPILLVSERSSARFSTRARAALHNRKLSSTMQASADCPPGLVIQAQLEIQRLANSFAGQLGQIHSFTAMRKHTRRVEIE